MLLEIQKKLGEDSMVETAFIVISIFGYFAVVIVAMKYSLDWYFRRKK